MVLSRCDACGTEEAQPHDHAAKNPKLFIQVGVYVGTLHFEGHACSEECFPKVIALKQKGEAAKAFAGIRP